MALTVKSDIVKLVVYSLGANLIDVVLLLGVLVLDLLDLILNDLELAFLVLKLLGINIDFTLEP